jgi:hypothetical protein
MSLESLLSFCCTTRSCAPEAASRAAVGSACSRFSRPSYRSTSRRAGVGGSAARPVRRAAAILVRWPPTLAVAASRRGGRLSVERARSTAAVSPELTTAAWSSGALAARARASHCSCCSRVAGLMLSERSKLDGQLEEESVELRLG